MNKFEMDGYEIYSYYRKSVWVKIAEFAAFSIFLGGLGILFAAHIAILFHA